MLLLRAESPINSGHINEMNLPITLDQWNDYMENSIPIQSAFPQLTVEQREFILTGASLAEQKIMFSPVEDEELDEEADPSE